MSEGMGRCSKDMELPATTRKGLERGRQTLPKQRPQQQRGQIQQSTEAMQEEEEEQQPAQDQRPQPPQPHRKEKMRGFTIATANVNSWGTGADIIDAVKADVLLVQEHRLKTKKYLAAVGQLQKKSFKVYGVPGLK